MPRTAKVFMTNRSQAVRLPKEFQFSTEAVFIRKEGEDVILSPRPPDWTGFLRSDLRASEDFMAGVEKLPIVLQGEVVVVRYVAPGRAARIALPDPSQHRLQRPNGRVPRHAPSVTRY